MLAGDDGGLGGVDEGCGEFAGLVDSELCCCCLVSDMICFGERGRFGAYGGGEKVALFLGERLELLLW